MSAPVPIGEQRRAVQQEIAFLRLNIEATHVNARPGVVDGFEARINCLEAAAATLSRLETGEQAGLAYHYECGHCGLKWAAEEYYLDCPKCGKPGRADAIERLTRERDGYERRASSAMDEAASWERTVQALQAALAARDAELAQRTKELNISVELAGETAAELTTELARVRAIAEDAADRLALYSPQGPRLRAALTPDSTQ